MLNLDTYECIDSKLYIRIKAQVTIPGEQKPKECFVYVQGPAIADEDIEGEWSYELYLERSGQK